MSRGLLNCPLITPNCGVPKERPGELNCTRLKRLNISVRNWIPTRSVMSVFLNTARLQSARPGERTSGKVRAKFPNVNGGGRVKAALLNHPFSLDCAEPLSWALCPVLLGR